MSLINKKINFNRRIRKNKLTKILDMKFPIDNNEKIYENYQEKDLNYLRNIINLENNELNIFFENENNFQIFLKIMNNNLNIEIYKLFFKILKNLFYYNFESKITKIINFIEIDNLPLYNTKTFDQINDIEFYEIYLLIFIKIINLDFMDFEKISFFSKCVIFLSKNYLFKSFQLTKIILDSFILIFNINKENLLNNEKYFFKEYENIIINFIYILNDYKGKIELIDLFIKSILIISILNKNINFLENDEKEFFIDYLSLKINQINIKEINICIRNLNDSCRICDYIIQKTKIINILLINLNEDFDNTIINLEIILENFLEKNSIESIETKIKSAFKNINKKINSYNDNKKEKYLIFLKKIKINFKLNFEYKLFKNDEN